MAETVIATTPARSSRSGLRSFACFVLGLIVGAGLLFGFQHLPQLAGYFVSPDQAMRTAVAGHWDGTIDVSGNDADFALDIKADGPRLSGVLTLPRAGAVPCDKLSVDPTGNVSFSVQVEENNGGFSGKIAPDHHYMSGNLTSTLGDGSWSLTKGH